MTFISHELLEAQDVETASYAEVLDFVNLVRIAPPLEALESSLYGDLIAHNVPFLDQAYISHHPGGWHVIGSDDKELRRKLAGLDLPVAKHEHACCGMVSKTWHILPTSISKAADVFLRTGEMPLDPN